jgi:hypothetical protein
MVAAAVMTDQTTHPVDPTTITMGTIPEIDLDRLIQATIPAI